MWQRGADKRMLVMKLLMLMLLMLMLLLTLRMMMHIALMLMTGPMMTKLAECQRAASVADAAAAP